MLFFHLKSSFFIQQWFLRHLSEFTSQYWEYFLEILNIHNSPTQASNFSFTLTRTVYPNGRCCRAVPPELSNTNLIYELEMFNKLERKENWKVLLLDRGYLSELKQNQFTMDGDPLETRNDSLGFGKYKIKIFEDNNIEDDPKYRCKGRIRWT